MPLLDTLVGFKAVPKRFLKVLQDNELKHNVLNAKQHEREAEIVAQAGRLGSVTISTNMAGRGTDILLGGNAESLARDSLRKQGAKFDSATSEQRQGTLKKFQSQVDGEHDDVVEVGGLHILGTERHESRRIDNQLRGRAGRQGDPGSSRFYLSLEDDLLRIFAGERISRIMHKLGMEEGVPIESRLISKRIEVAQKTVESQNFESRKHLLEYDDVMNKQRETIYGLRRRLQEGHALIPAHAFRPNDLFALPVSVSTKRRSRRVSGPCSPAKTKAPFSSDQSSLKLVARAETQI